MAFKEINPGIWTPEKEEDFIAGTFLRAEKEVGVNKSMLYHFEVDGKSLSVWGSAVLDQKMAWIKPGQLVRITFKGFGEKVSGKHAPKIFKVEVNDDNE